MLEIRHGLIGAGRSLIEVMVVDDCLVSMTMGHHVMVMRMRMSHDDYCHAIVPRWSARCFDDSSHALNG